MITEKKVAKCVNLEKGISHKVDFSDFIHKVSQSEWYLDNIPDYHCYSETETKIIPSWVIYWDKFKEEWENAKVKPHLIYINKNCFWAFFKYLIEGDYLKYISLVEGSEYRKQHRLDN